MKSSRKQWDAGDAIQKGALEDNPGAFPHRLSPRNGARERKYVLLTLTR